MYGDGDGRAGNERGNEGGKREIELRDKMMGDNGGETKRQGQIAKGQRAESQKKEKELYKFKDLHPNTELIKTLAKE